MSPRSDPIFGKMRWTEVGGNVCRPWSKMGAQHGIIDAATLPMLVWIYSMRFYEPDDILNECVPEFDPNILLRVLNEDDNEAPKHHASRPLRVGEFHTRTLGMFSIKMRPPDVGIPSNGLRVFTHFSLSEFVKSCVPAHLQKDVFKSLFFANAAAMLVSTWLIVEIFARSSALSGWASALKTDGGPVLLDITIFYHGLLRFNHDF